MWYWTRLCTWSLAGEVEGEVRILNTCLENDDVVCCLVESSAAAAFGYHDLGTPIVTKTKYNPANDSGDIQQKDMPAPDVEPAEGVLSPPVSLVMLCVW